MTIVRRMAGIIPVEVYITGRRSDALFRGLDFLFKRTVHGDIIVTPQGPLVLDAAHQPERLLSYAFKNVLRGYKHSDLGRFISSTDGKGATFIDVGANLGMYTLIAREHGYRTVAVEPDPMHSAFLKRNEATFGKVLSVAFSDEPGQLPLYYDPGNPGATSLFPGSSYVKGDRPVPVETFSAAASRGDFGEPRDIGLVKIDVEGFEAKAVRGMTEFLVDGPRPAIWCEVRGDLSGRNGGSFRDVCEILFPFGYSAFDVGNTPTQAQESWGNRGVFDLLFRT